MTKDEEREALRQENRLLRAQVARLSERIKVLEAQQAKDSHNSHLPPSSDRFHRQPKSLRKKSGKKPGGQTGHPGSTVLLSSSPDTAIVHPVEHCQHCHEDVRAVVCVQVERRQVIDLPRRQRGGARTSGTTEVLPQLPADQQCRISRECECAGAVCSGLWSGRSLPGATATVSV